MRLLLVLLAAGCAATAAAPAAVCVLDIRGTPRSSGIAGAAVECSGSPVTLGVDSALLARFAPRFRGVQLDTDCGLPGCLLSFCGSSRVTIRDSTITGVTGLNRRASPSLVCALASSRLELRATLLSSSSARGLRAANASHVIIDGSRIANNSCACVGAGVAAGGSANVTITGSGVTANNASHGSDGGGLAVSDSARLLVTGASRIADNHARGGGGLATWGSASVTIAGDAVVANNTSHDRGGGGVSVDGAASLLVTGASRIAGNAALNTSGGGLVAWHSANVTIAGSCAIADNTSHGRDGGGVAIDDTASLLVTGDSRITGNTARNASGGGLVIWGSANVTVAGRAAIANNTSLGNDGGGLAVGDSARLLVTGASRIADNHARGGGGLAAWSSASVTIGGGAVVAGNAVNTSGGGLVADESANVTITGHAAIANNTSLSIGGGLFAGADARLLITGNSRIAGNTAQGSPGGGLAAVANSRISIAGASVVANNTASQASGGGAAVFQAAQLAIGGDAAFLRNWVDINYSAPDIYAEGTSGLRFAPPPAGLGGRRPGRLTKCSDGVLWERRPGAGGNVPACEVGEVVKRRLCDCCPRGMFSLNTSAAACEPCPAHASCSEGAVITPDAEFWHSEPRSAQIHRCPNPGACLAGGECAPGYAGALCGACGPGFGVTTPFQCSRCVSLQRQLAIYACATLALVLAIAATVYFTWVDNLSQDKAVRASDLIKVLVQFLQYLVIVGSVSAPWPAFLRTLFRMASVVFAASSGQVVSLDCLLLSRPVARGGGGLPLAIQRQLFYLLAPLFVVAAVVCVQALVWVATQCVQRTLGQRRPVRARSHVALSRLPPAVAASARPLLLRQLPVTLLVVFYYAYPTLTKASLGFFACITIDASSGPYPQHARLSAAHGYWVSDVRQACFESWHRRWALGLGVPCVLLLCVGVPLGMGGLLWASRARTGEPWFSEHFGFLYRNFRDARVWWEAVWAAQTVLLTAIAAFHFSLGAFYSMLALHLVFAASAVVQVVCRPYASHRLHVLHAGGTACLLFVTWGALALFNIDASASTWQGVAIGALMVALCAAFVGCCAYCIAAVTTSTLSRLCAKLKLPRWCPGSCCAAPGACVRLPALGKGDARGAQP